MVWEERLIESLLDLLSGLVRFGQEDVWIWKTYPLGNFSVRVACDYLVTLIGLP